MNPQAIEELVRLAADGRAQLNGEHISAEVFARIKQLDEEVGEFYRRLKRFPAHRAGDLRFLPGTNLRYYQSQVTTPSGEKKTGMRVFPSDLWFRSMQELLAVLSLGAIETSRFVYQVCATGTVRETGEKLTRRSNTVFSTWARAEQRLELMRTTVQEALDVEDLELRVDVLELVE